MTAIETGDRRVERPARPTPGDGRSGHRVLDLDTVLTAIVDDARSLLGADSGDILLWDRERDRLGSSRCRGTRRTCSTSRWPSAKACRRRPYWPSGRSGSTTTRPPSIERLRSTALPSGRSSALRSSSATSDRRPEPPCDPGWPSIRPRRCRPAGGVRRPCGDRDRPRPAVRERGEARTGAGGHERELSRSLVVQQRLAEQVLLDAGPGSPRSLPPTWVAGS